MRRSRDSLWVVGLLALVALGAATFRLHSGVDSARSPQARASQGASPADPVAPTKRSADPRCCAALLCDLARALPPSVYLADLQAEPDRGTVNLACVATREGRSIDLDLVGTTIHQFQGLACFGHASLYSGAPLVTPMPMGAFALSATYPYDERASLASTQAFSGQGMSLERNVFTPVGSGPPPGQVLALSDSGLHDEYRCSNVRVCFLTKVEAWVARLGATRPEFEIVSICPPPRGRYPGEYTIPLRLSVEALSSLLLAMGSRFGSRIGVRMLRIAAPNHDGGSSRSPCLSVGLDVQFPPHEWERPPLEPPGEH